MIANPRIGLLTPTFTLALTLAGNVLLAADAPRHRLLTADSSSGRIAIIDEQGKTEWEMKIGPLHDLHLLDNGHVLLQTTWTQIIEVDPQTQETVWQYDATQSPGNAQRQVEVHSFQRLPNGNTLIAESGAGRIIEVDAQGRVVHQMPLQRDQPHPHHETRLVRLLPQGTILVCHESEGIVREYTRDGKIVWEYPVPLFGLQRASGHGPDAFGNQCFAAIRLANGNTLIATGNGHRLLEVTPAKEIVWQLQPSDLPDIDLAWITTLQQLPNGNLVFGNCHAGKQNPQVIEITRDKRVVWTFHDFERFGNALTNTQILSTDGVPLTAKLGQQR
ncbi:MAG: PQQ-binding-like beta-propeller repeat protein [Planctomycetales bacterium]|nr:PQQ-binding-like beta-propeller repeat protein [Planctomycetales bacterium]